MRRVVVEARLLLLVMAVMIWPADAWSGEASPDTSDQLWFNLILSRPKTDALYFEYDVEAATQVSGGGDDWRSLTGTGLVEYYPNGFVDLTGELITGFTEQDREEDSFEVTARVGLRLHLISQIINSPYFKEIRPERLSGERISVANFARLEYRNFWYSGDRPSSDDVRFRDRIEFKAALNRPTLASDGVWYGIASAEWFVPLSDDEAAERFATKRRLRVGLGYRRSYEYRYELIASRDHARDTLEGDVSVDANMLNFRFKWFF